LQPSPRSGVPGRARSNGGISRHRSGDAESRPLLREDDRGRRTRRQDAAGLAAAFAARAKVVLDAKVTAERLSATDEATLLAQIDAWGSDWRTQSVTRRATIVTRKTWPSRASTATSACSSPRAGDRSPNPGVVKVTKLKYTYSDCECGPGWLKKSLPNRAMAMYTNAKTSPVST